MKQNIIFSTITLLFFLCVSRAKGNSQCKLYSTTPEQERAQKYHWEFVTLLKKKGETKKTDEYVDWIGTKIVNGQSIYFEGSIHKGSIPNQTGMRAVYMLNRLADTSLKDAQKKNTFRMTWLLKNWSKGNTGLNGVVPTYILAHGDNCSGFNELVPFQAEDVEGVIVSQLI